MDNFFTILVLAGVFLLPLLWWMMAEHGNSRPESGYGAPPEGSRAPHSAYGAPDPAPTADSPTVYQGPFTADEPAQQQTSLPWAPSPAGQQVEFHEEEGPPALAIAEGPFENEAAIMPEGGPAAPEGATPLARSRPPQSRRRRRRSAGRMVRSMLRSKQGLRQAVLLQSVIGPPKALERESGEATG
ncbi:MAG: hypothetical protein WD533_01190 [Dehalococcoidia bacterium]